MTTPFSQAIALSPELTATIGPEWSQGRAAFGGLLSGMMLHALEPDSQGHPLRSVMIDFLAPAGVGEVQVATEVLRVGRSMIRLRATVHQDSRLCATLIAAYGPRRQTALSVEAPTMPPAPPPESITPMPWIEGMIPRFVRQFDYRYIDGRTPYSGQETSGVGGWVRLKDTAAVGPAGVLALIDAWPSPALPMLHRPAPASTVTWMVNLSEIPADIPPEVWWRFEAGLIRSEGGFSDTRGQLWTPDGRLVATSNQLVAEFSRL